MAATTHLSREQAVALSAELGEVAERLRDAAARYQLQHTIRETPWYRLPELMLAKLEPFAHDPAVAAKAQRSGLKIPPALAAIPPRLAKHAVGGSVSDRSSPCPSPKTAAENPTASPGKYMAGLHRTGPVLLGSEALSSGKVSTVGRLLQPQALEGQGGCCKSQEPCTLRVVPKFGSGAAPRAFNVARESGATVLDLRRKLSIKMGVSLARVWLAPELDGGKNALLDDAEQADRATSLHISNRVFFDGAKPLVGTSALSRERVRALAHELLDGLREMDCRGPVSKEAVRTLHASVLPKHGFPGDEDGVMAMLQAFDGHLGDPEIARVGDAINEKLGHPPQTYQVREAVRS